MFPGSAVDHVVCVLLIDCLQLMLLSQKHLQEVDRLIKAHDEESSKLQQVNEIVSSTCTFDGFLDQV